CKRRMQPAGARRWTTSSSMERPVPSSSVRRRRLQRSSWRRRWTTMEWREDEDEARTSLYEQDEYQMYSGNPLDDPHYVPDTRTVRAIYATDYYMVQVRGGHDELERAERFDRRLAAEKAKWQAEAVQGVIDYLDAQERLVQRSQDSRIDRIEKGERP